MSEPEDQVREPELQVPVEVPPLDGVYAEPFSPGKLLRLASFFGPAAVAASVSIGAGETLIVVLIGSWARYRLLWMVALACLVKGVFVTYLLGRYTAVTGEYLGHRLARLPGPRGWLLLLIVAAELSVAAPICAVIARPCGELLSFIFSDQLPSVGSGGEPTFWSTVFAVAFIALALLGSLTLSYERLEKQNLIICGILVLGTLVAGLMIRPDFGQAVRGTLAPSFPLTPWTAPATNGDSAEVAPVADPPEAGQYDLRYFLLMVTVFGYVGNTVFGYIVYANWVGVHGWGMTGHSQIAAIRRHAATTGRLDYLPCEPEQVMRVLARLQPLSWDVGLGALVLFIVTASFMTAGAQVLYPLIESGGLERIPAWGEVLTEQRHVWQAMHPALVPVYYVCIVAALWGTMNALPEIWSRVTHEFLAAVWPRFERVDARRFQAVMVLVLLAATVGLLVAGTGLPLLAAFIATITCNVAVCVMAGVAVYLNATLPAAYRPRTWCMIAGVVTTLILAVAAAGGLIGLAAKLGLWS